MLFEPVSEELILKALRLSKQQGREQYRHDMDMAVDYLNGKQYDHVAEALLNRYPNTQIGDAGQEIVPVFLPLVERYIAEAASAYNRPVDRCIVDPNGDENGQLTDGLKKYLDRCGYDEKMHRNEQLSLLFGTSCVWYQEKRGMLRPVITYPQDVYPIINPNDPLADPSDPNDYLGFVVEVVWSSDDMGLNNRTFAALLNQEIFFFEAKDPYSPIDKIIDRYPNRFVWPQLDDSGKIKDYPLQMLTFWHKQQYEGELIVKTDSDIVLANHELNIQWSLLFDTMRIQGWDTPVMNLVDPSKAPAKQKHGSRFPVVLDVGETYQLMSANAPYTEIVEALKTYAKFLAVAKRQSPNDFSIEQQAVASGFAKLVDSLPKIEARKERLRRLKRLEEQIAWPRIASIMRKEGLLPVDIYKYSLSVKFADVEFPRSPDEIAKQYETDIKYGITSPIKIIMQKFGVSKKEAEEIYKENKQFSKELEEQLPPQRQLLPGQQPATQVLASLIGQRKATINNGQNKPSS